VVPVPATICKAVGTRSGTLTVPECGGIHVGRDGAVEGGPDGGRIGLLGMQWGRPQAEMHNSKNSEDG